MKNPAVVFLVLTSALVVFCAVFLWNPPSPRFYPIERTWRMPDEPAPGPAMGWYGRTGVALAASTLAAVVAALGVRIGNARGRLEMGPPKIYAILAVVVVVLAITFAGIVHEQRAWFKKEPSILKPDHEY